MKKGVGFTRGFEGMRSHYEFSGGVRAKHANAYACGTNRVSLDPDVAKVFPNSKSVNDALRALADLAKKQAKPERRRKVG